MMCVCVGGPQLCAYGDVVGNGPKACCSPLLSGHTGKKDVVGEKRCNIVTEW